jgi:hypothetical protein
MIGATPMGTTSESQGCYTFMRIKMWCFTGCIAFPTVRGPDLKLLDHPDHERVTVNLRVLAELGGDEHPPLAIQGTDVSTGTEIPYKGAGGAIIGQVEQLGLDDEPFGLGIEHQAILEELGNHQRGVVRGVELVQGIPQACRHTEPSLVVQVQAIFPEKHSRLSHFGVLVSHFLPLPPTWADYKRPIQPCQGRNA